MVHRSVSVVRRISLIVLLLLVAVFLWPIGEHLIEQLPSIIFRRSPHDQYVRELRRTALDATPEGQQWLADAERALASPDELPMAFTRTLRVGPADMTARAWRFPVRRGQQLTIDAAFSRGAVFIDLFRAGSNERLASAPRDSSRLTHIIGADDELIARVQPLLGRHGTVRVAQRADATLRFPVQGVTASAVWSSFGEGRDRGQRRHEGIDIFAARGTPAVAAADGWITAQTSNSLGGNVVWIWALRHGVALYYAHLGRRAVAPGEWVDAGEIVGYVGNTGNAHGTAPHLHFGVYARPGGAVDPLPFVCDAPCGERLMHPSPPPRRRQPHVASGFSRKILENDS